MSARDIAFKLVRTREALETANKWLAEQGMLGVLVDTIDIADDEAAEDAQIVEILKQADCY